MVLSHYTATPVSLVWEMTIRQFMAYCKELPTLVKLTSPWGAEEPAPRLGSSRPTSADKTEMLLRSFGIEKTG